MTITVNWETATSVTAAAMRAGLAAAMSKSAPVTARDGCLRSTALAPTAAGGSMAVSIAAGQAMISGYQFTSDATVTVTLDVGGATARTDLIVARVYDAEAGDAQTKGAIEVVKGTSTTVPATPARAIALASVVVGASVSTISSSNLTELRTWTAGAGGMLLLPGGLASTPPSGLDDGTPVWDAQAHQIGVKEGASWRKFTDVGSLIGGADYTPTVTALTTNPSGYTAEGRWTRIGNIVACRFLITLGSNLGSGGYLVSMPIAPNSSWENKDQAGAGPCSVRKGTNIVQGVCRIYTQSRVLLTVPTGTNATANIDASTPFALDNTTILTGTLTYEAA